MMKQISLVIFILALQPWYAASQIATKKLEWIKESSDNCHLRNHVHHSIVDSLAKKSGYSNSFIISNCLDSDSLGYGVFRYQDQLNEYNILYILYQKDSLLFLIYFSRPDGITFTNLRGYNINNISYIVVLNKKSNPIFMISLFENFYNCCIPRSPSDSVEYSIGIKYAITIDNLVLTSNRIVLNERIDFSQMTVLDLLDLFHDLYRNNFGTNLTWRKDLSPIPYFR